MKKILSVLAFQLAAVSFTFAQQPMIYLTGYTYSDKKASIGQVMTAEGKPLKQFKISGRDASSVEINKSGELVVKAATLKKSPKNLEISITAGKGGQQYTENYTLLADEFNRNKVIAHRGAWKKMGTPENSIAALKEAVKLGCYGSEFDVHLSADGVIFVNHDPEIQGVSMEKSDAAKLNTVRLKDGEPLPQLENFLKAGMNQQTTKLILEIKPSVVSPERSIQLTHEALKIIRKLKAEAWVEYISFDYAACKEVIKLAPYAKVSYLKGDKSPDELAADHFFGLDYHYSVLQKNPDWVKSAKAHKLAINVWTVNDAAVMDEMLNTGADYITTNEPELLFEKVK